MTETKPAPELATLRVLAAVVGLPALAYAVLSGARLLTAGRTAGDLFLLPIPLCALVLGSLLLWFAVGSSRAPRWRIASALLGGILIGGVAFAAGFAGPLVLAPDSNQGPLLGFFVTGPLGFIAGCIVGALMAGRLARSRERLQSAPPSDLL
jgi:hypothetical protein